MTLGSFYNLYKHLDFDSLAQDYYAQYESTGHDLESNIVVVLVAYNPLDPLNPGMSSLLCPLSKFPGISRNKIPCEIIAQECPKGKRFVYFSLLNAESKLVEVKG